jgi:2'-5' RNA ligase
MPGMSTLEIVARPVFGKAELEWLTRLRAVHAKSPGPPEFTLVFPGAAERDDDVVAHAEAIGAATPRIHFVLRSAVIVPESGAGTYHVFLVPEEGFGAIIRLHDRLHVGPLAGFLRPEQPYIPHLTVVTVRDFERARHTKAQLNARDLAVSGRIDAIELRRRDGVSARRVATVALGRHGLFH